MQVFLSVSPQEVRAASRFTQNLAHTAYRIGPESTLLRRDLLLETRNGLLSVDDQDSPKIDDPEKLAAAVLRECARRGYGGAVLGFDRPPSVDRSTFAALLAGLLTRSRRTLYVTEPYAVPGAVTLVNTALSGGNYTDRLLDAQKRYGRIALDVQRLSMDFLLPSRTGEGRSLTREQTTALLDQEAPSVFFSQELFARYFTYSSDGQTHFVLYDDADTLLRKIRASTAYGIQSAFLLYPEVQDLLPKLFEKAET